MVICLLFFKTKEYAIIIYFKCIIVTHSDFGLLLLLLLLKLILKYIAHNFICVRFCVRGHLTKFDCVTS